MAVLELHDGKFTAWTEGMLIEMKNQKMFISRKTISTLYLQDCGEYNQKIICKTINNETILIGSWENNYSKNSKGEYNNQGDSTKVYNFIMKYLYSIPEGSSNDTYGLYS
jgi:hypothetical protein